MKTYKILNNLEDIVKTIKVKNLQEANDIIFDLKDYHGHSSVFILEEIK